MLQFFLLPIFAFNFYPYWIIDFSYYMNPMPGLPVWKKTPENLKWCNLLNVIGKSDVDSQPKFLVFVLLGCGTNTSHLGTKE